DGPYRLYNDHGQLMAKGKFKKDKLHGKFYTYSNGGKILERKVYKMGNEVLSRRSKREKKEREKIEEKGSDKQNENKVDETGRQRKFFKRLFKRKDKSNKDPVGNKSAVITA